MAEISRGEIWMVVFPRPDKSRPVLVLTREDMISRLSTVTVAPITSTIRGVPSEVVIGPECGLKHPSAVNLHHLVTLPQSGLRKYVGIVSSERLEQVRRAMLFALGFGGEGSS